MTRGEELFAALNGVRNFLNDLGQLLVAGDMLMAAQSWEPTGDATCLQGLSYGVYEGRRWMPRAAYRRYRNAAEYPRILAMISLLLDEEKHYALKEPLICGLFFLFPEGTREEDVSVDPWNALWPGWRDAPTDGTPIAVDEHDSEWKAKWGWRYMQAFARPLVEVTNQDTLKEKLVDPLLAAIAGYSDIPGDGGRNPSGS